MLAKNRLFLCALTLLAPGSVEVLAQTNGEELYAQNCMACHGDDGSGAMPGVADLTENKSWRAISNEELLTSIKLGIQKPNAPVSMPPKGGNPDLTDIDLKEIVKHMKKEFSK